MIILIQTATLMTLHHVIQISYWMCLWWWLGHWHRLMMKIFEKSRTTGQMKYFVRCRPSYVCSCTETRFHSKKTTYTRSSASIFWRSLAEDWASASSVAITATGSSYQISWAPLRCLLNVCPCKLNSWKRKSELYIKRTLITFIRFEFNVSFWEI